MSISNTTHSIPLSQIEIRRSSRQRRVFTTDDLEASISRQGLINPIVVRKVGEQIVLVAGERRLAAYRNLKLPTILVRFAEGEDETIAQIIELEENIARQNLIWTEHVTAVWNIHKIYLESEAKWSIHKTASALGYDDGNIRKMIEVAEALAADDPTLKDCCGYGQAHRILVGRKERRREQENMALRATITEDFVAAGTAEPAAEPTAPLPPTLPNLATEAPSSPILNLDALKFFQSYDGIPFNFLHCDFPYGIGIQSSDQAHAENHGTYDDNAEIYWELLGTLCSNLNSILSPSAHIMFWFSPRNGLYEQTQAFFSKHAPDLWLQDIPLVWHKTDNKGILPDSLRQPRNITEFAFILTRGDRKLVSPVGNCYGAPTSKVIHQSEKPIPMLKHFFRMFVDTTTRMLDPTSGSANALIAAHSRGAESVLGLELDPEYHTLSSQAFAKYLKLKTMENKDD